jgi:hypothetical protein
MIYLRHLASPMTTPTRTVAPTKPNATNPRTGTRKGCAACSWAALSGLGFGATDADGTAELTAVDWVVATDGAAGSAETAVVVFASAAGVSDGAGASAGAASCLAWRILWFM